MKDHIKRILVGMGFTFGLHVLISLIFTAVAFSAATSRTECRRVRFSSVFRPDNWRVPDRRLLSLVG
jgi:hypothetical protein